MAKKSRLWDEVDAAVAAGRVPSVLFPKASKVILPPKANGRPRTRPIGIKHFKNWCWRMKTPSGRAMRCRNQGCKREVPGNEYVIVCRRPQCFTELLRYCRWTLDVLEGRVHASEYPPQYRAWKKNKLLTRFAQIVQQERDERGDRMPGPKKKEKTEWRKAA